MLVGMVGMKMIKIPHKCARCDKQLYLETRTYWKGKYYCKNHWGKKNG